jgi:thymidylate kinase
VLFDRHFFFDYYFYDVAPNGADRLFSSRVHGYLLQNFYPKPDLVICLDAPAEVLFARKGEGTLESIQRRRDEYGQLRDVVQNFVTVDAAQPQDEVLADVIGLIRDFYQGRAGK